MVLGVEYLSSVLGFSVSTIPYCLSQSLSNKCPFLVLSDSQWSCILMNLMASPQGYRASLVLGSGRHLGSSGLTRVLMMSPTLFLSSIWMRVKRKNSGHCAKNICHGCFIFPDLPSFMVNQRDDKISTRSTNCSEVLDSLRIRQV